MTTNANEKRKGQKEQKTYFPFSSLRTVDLNRLYDDVKRYSCTPRNYSVNLREELRATNAVFFPRCLLVKRCGGNCGCGTDNWNNGCTCQASKTTAKLHEVGLPTWRHSGGPVLFFLFFFFTLGYCEYGYFNPEYDLFLNLTKLFVCLNITKLQ